MEGGDVEKKVGGEGRGGGEKGRGGGAGETRSLSVED